MLTLARGEPWDGELQLRWMEPTSRGTIPAFGRLKWPRRNGCGDVRRRYQRPRQMCVSSLRHRGGGGMHRSALPAFFYLFCFFGTNDAAEC